MASIASIFSKHLEGDEHNSLAVAAVKTLTDVIKASKATTIMGVEIELKAAVDQLKCAVADLDLVKRANKTAISLTAVCDLFMRYVLRISLDVPDFEECKTKLIERGESFARITSEARQQIATFVDKFIRDGLVILTLGHSMVVTEALLRAAKNGKNFKVVVLEGRPDGAGYLTARTFEAAGIPVKLVLDSAMGYIMETVDVVLVGAEGVVESGGIINKIGTLSLAVVASAFKKPVYVAAESFKFARLFPLSQRDFSESQQLPLQVLPPSVARASLPESVQVDNPTCDYTPPEYITLLFTDLGILTTSAVSDELIKLYS